MTTGPESKGLTIEVTDAPDATAREAIVEPLRAFNAERTSLTDARPLAVLVKGADGGVRGGLWGRTVYGWLFVELLVIPAPWRGQGLGTEVMRRAEQEAIARGCHDAWLDTFEFQAPGFYAKLGYRCFGELADYPPGGRRYFMTKRLAAGGPAPRDAVLPEPFRITTDRARLDVDAALALLHHTPWARRMTRTELVTAMQHSLCFGLLQGDRLAGFARVITDRATFAYLTDVVIAEDVRGKGLGQALIRVIVAHPDLQGLRRFALLTADAVALYEGLGFQVGAGELTYMERR